MSVLTFDISMLLLHNAAATCQTLSTAGNTKLDRHDNGPTYQMLGVGNNKCATGKTVAFFILCEMLAENKNQHLGFLVTSDKKLFSLIWHLWLLWHLTGRGVLWLRGGIMSVLVASPFRSLVYMMQERWEMASYDCCGTKMVRSEMPTEHYYSILVGIDVCASVFSDERALVVHVRRGMLSLGCTA